MIRILIVDDEPNIVEFLTMNLKLQGFVAEVAYDGEEALCKVATSMPDLILLDQMLPGISGMETCMRLKSDPHTSKIPIIFLSAKSEEGDKVAGLSSGADDYITKPFSLRELFARIEAVLRRSLYASSAAGTTVWEAAESPARTAFVTFKDLVLDVARRKLYRKDIEIPLTQKEFDVLHRLIGATGAIVARETLIAEFGMAGGDLEGRSLDVHIRNLRKKLGKGESYIVTVRGVGYRANI